MDYELIIGLEVHIQLNTQSKMFCGCSNDAVGAQPNTLVCPVCFGMPGMLPVANKEAIHKTFLLGKALGAELAPSWNFERKNYFYPDLPKGYQITSSTNPPLLGGIVQFLEGGQTKSVHIHHAHLEEDAGKLIHGQDGYSYVDLNRAGTPLVELVTEPDLRSAPEARAFLQEMQMLVRQIRISEGDMENGHLRCDANVSIRKVGDTVFGKRVEIKNLNSFQSVEKALNYEKKRQIEVVEAGENVVQETRGWDENKLVTVSHRHKEDSPDYRYMPEPDIPPIVRQNVPLFSDQTLSAELPELPHTLRQRLMKNWGLSPEQANILISDPAFGKLTEAVLQKLDGDSDAQKTAVKLLFSDVRRLAVEQDISTSALHLTSDDIAQITHDLVSQRLTHQLFKTHLVALLNGAMTLDEMTSEANAAGRIDIPTFVQEVLSENQSAVQQYQSGDTKVLGFLVGKVMAKAKGCADPQSVNALLLAALKQTFSKKDDTIDI